MFLRSKIRNQDGKKSLPIQSAQTKEFEKKEEAKRFFETNQKNFDRVVLMEIAEGKQNMLERYVEGKHEVPEKKQEA